MSDDVAQVEDAFTRDICRAPAEVQAEATVEKSSGGAVIVDELEAKVNDAEKEREEEKQRKKREADTERENRERQREARGMERQADEDAPGSEIDRSPTETKRPKSSA